MRSETESSGTRQTESDDVRVVTAPQQKYVTETYGFDSRKKLAIRTVQINGKIIETSLPSDHTEVSFISDAQNIFDKTFLRTPSGSEEIVQGTAVGVVDLFAGCGGLSLGIREACRATGNLFEPLLAIDSDSQALEIYKDNFNPKKSSDRGIWELVSGELGDEMQQSEQELLKGIISPTILLAGPPCQGHSNLNNHTRRKDERNHLYERVGRFAEISDVRFILIENVPTVVHDKNESMRKTYDLLQNLGYNVDEHIVNLRDLGVPQRRKRHVLAASRDGEFIVEDIVKKYKVTKERSVRWAIEDLEDADGLPFDTPANVSDVNKSRIEYLHNEDEYDLPNHLRPVCHHGDHRYPAMYGRLHYDISAPTITTGFGSPGQGRYVHPSRKRTLTPHEAARLQFFPDSFSFSKAITKRDFSKAIGNAVPMKLSYIFGLEFMSQL